MLSTNFPNRLINTSELYTSSSTLHSGGTMPKMSFAPMKEEMSRTLPTKGFNLAEAAARQDGGEEKKEGEERREKRQDGPVQHEPGLLPHPHGRHERQLLYL